MELHVFFFPHFPVAVDGLRFEVDAQIENLDTLGPHMTGEYHDMIETKTVLSFRGRGAVWPPLPQRPLVI